jgi:hypothetical protein
MEDREWSIVNGEIADDHYWLILLLRIQNKLLAFTFRRTTDSPLTIHD